MADRYEDTAPRLAGEATQGPWRAGDVETWHVFAPSTHEDAMGPERVLLRMNAHFPFAADAALIAYHHPARVVALAAVVARLRDRVAKGHAYTCGARAWVRTQAAERAWDHPCACGHEDDVEALRRLDEEA